MCVCVCVGEGVVCVPKGEGVGGGGGGCVWRGRVGGGSDDRASQWQGRLMVWACELTWILCLARSSWALVSSRDSAKVSA